jgi:hypothetical protein
VLMALSLPLGWGEGGGLLPLGGARAACAGGETSASGRFRQRSPIGISVVTVVLAVVLLPLVRARVAGVSAEACAWVVSASARATVVLMVLLPLPLCEARAGGEMSARVRFFPRASEILRQSFVCALDPCRDPNH